MATKKQVIEYWMPPSEYNFVFNRAVRFCVDLLVEEEKLHIRQGKIIRQPIVTKRNTAPFCGMYNLPGGRVFFGESIKDAIHRIAKVELSTIVESYQFIGVMEHLNEKVGRQKRHSVSLVYKCSTGAIRKTNSIRCDDGKLPMIPEHSKFLKQQGYR